MSSTYRLERDRGVQEYRQRLLQSGIDPDRIGSPFGAPPNPEASGLAVAAAAAGDAASDQPTENPAHYLGLLEELHDLPWIGMDLCEVAPPYDHAQLTSNAAASFVWTSSL